MQKSFSCCMVEEKEKESVSVTDKNKNIDRIANKDRLQAHIVCQKKNSLKTKNFTYH